MELRRRTSKFKYKSRGQGAASQQDFECAARILQTLAGFSFTEQALMDCFATDIIDAVGRLEEVRVDADELEVVIDLMEQIAEGGRMPVAACNKASEIGRELLLHGFLHDRPAHHRAGCVETIEVAAGGLVEVAIGLLRCGRSDDTLSQVRGAGGCRLDQRNQLKSNGRSKQVVLMRIERALNLLPGGNLLRLAGCEEASEMREALAGVQNEALMHLMGQRLPAVNESRGVTTEVRGHFLICHLGQNSLQLREAPGSGKLCDGMAELAARRIGLGLAKKLLFEIGNGDRHGTGHRDWCLWQLRLRRMWHCL